MSFVLVGIGGLHSAQDSEFAVSKQPLLIGSSPGNHIQISHVAVSARHCRLELHSAGVLLSRTDPSASLFVNTLPVTRSVLRPGDTLKIGPAMFRLEERMSETPAGPAKLPDEGQEDYRFLPVLRLTREEMLRSGDASDPMPSLTEIAGVASAGRTRHAWKTLLKIVTAVNAIEGLVGLEEPLLEMLGDFLAVERSAILSRDASSNELRPLLTWCEDCPQTITVPQSVVQETMLTGTAVLGALHPVNAAGRSGPLPVRSVLAAPMMAFDHAAGIIYLEGKENAYDRCDLEFLSAVAATAAIALEHARQRERLARENLRLRARLEGEHALVGEHPSLHKVYGQILKAAPGNTTVLVTGESGTGKELVARAIHTNSPRAHKPFIAINCAALTETLLESELFGYERGAFTGANSLRIGLIETAKGGTLFLDEVSEMSTGMQAKLLRVLQEREFERVGGRHPIKVDVRVIAASNRDLERAVKDGAFRQDLLFRLNVIGIKLPPLRERKSDILLLAAHFAAKHAPRNARTVPGLSKAAQACLLHYSWPGNVRELENAIEHAIVLGESEVIGPEDLPEALLEGVARQEPGEATYHTALRSTKRQLILAAVAQANGSYVKAAQRLGVHPNYLHRLIRTMGLKPELEKRAAGM